MGLYLRGLVAPHSSPPARPCATAEAMAVRENVNTAILILHEIFMKKPATCPHA
jgi:hypothetical protein